MSPVLPRALTTTAERVIPEWVTTTAAVSAAPPLPEATRPLLRSAPIDLLRLSTAVFSEDCKADVDRAVEWAYVLVEQRGLHGNKRLYGLTAVRALATEACGDTDLGGVDGLFYRPAT
jgi:hypothetical protein